MNISTLRRCPRCGELVSYDGNNDPYCAYSNCLWNNEDWGAEKQVTGVSLSVKVAEPVVAHSSVAGSGVLHQFGLPGESNFEDCRFVLAKGAGPGIWNRWVSNSCKRRFHHAYVRGGYLS